MKPPEGRPGLRIISGLGGADDIGRESARRTTAKRTENGQFSPYVPTGRLAAPGMGRLFLTGRAREGPNDPPCRESRAGAGAWRERCPG
jgi:hypothetical protein